MNKYEQGWLDEYLDDKHKVLYYIYILICAAMGYYLFSYTYHTAIAGFMFGLSFFTGTLLFLANKGVFLSESEKEVKLFQERLTTKREQEFNRVRHELRMYGYSYDDIYKGISERDKAYGEEGGFGLLGAKLCKDAEIK